MISLTTDAQELEPRAINNLPLGTNFAIGGYNFAQGNLLLDPALPIKDLKSNIHSALLGYVRSISFFNLSAKVDAAKKHTLKFAYNSGIRFKRGPDFDAISLGYQYRWNNKINKQN